MGKVNQAVRGGSDAVVQALDAGKVVLKKFDEALIACCGAEVRTKCALPKAAWAPTIFEVEAFGCGPVHFTATWPRFGLMSCNMLVEGDCSIMGVKVERIPGSTYAD